MTGPAEGDAPRLPDDGTLVARLRAGDDATFALVVTAWSGGMRRLARCFVTTPASADEVVQDAWLGVIEGLDRFAGRSTLRTWAYRILVNTARRRAEREGRSIPWSSLAADDGVPAVEPDRFQGRGDPYPGHWREPPAPWPSPEQHLQDGEIRAVLEAALARLPARQRVVITLRDIEGYSAAEACAVLDISAANQRVLLHRARALVRGRLEEYHTSVSEGTALA